MKSLIKGGLQNASDHIFWISAETVNLVLLCFFVDAVRCAVSADVKMVARKRPPLALAG